MPLPTLTRREWARKRALHRLRFMDPRSSRRLVEDEAFRSRPFFDLCVDFCDGLCRTKPDDGYSYARHLPELAGKIPLGDRGHVERYQSLDQRAAYQVWAYAVLGQACSMAEKPHEAQAAFDDGLSRLPGPTWVEAELTLRHGFHLVRAGEAEGLKVLERSLDLWTRAEAGARGPRAYFARAVFLEVLADLAPGPGAMLLEKAVAWSRTTRLTPTLLPPYDFPRDVDRA